MDLLSGGRYGFHIGKRGKKTVTQKLKDLIHSKTTVDSTSLPSSSVSDTQQESLKDQTDTFMKTPSLLYLIPEDCLPQLDSSDINQPHTTSQLIVAISPHHSLYSEVLVLNGTAHGFLQTMMIPVQPTLLVRLTSHSASERCSSHRDFTLQRIHLENIAHLPQAASKDNHLFCHISVQLQQGWSC
ncbi:hypothetical protein J6590_021725 [Homalodisca vitripennis]|nr:hypothetical protein J6590_021725 [Homalodisca vitripennis]